MILIEIENKSTGAKLQVPGRYTFIGETFEKSVENYTWEEWTAPAETTAANVREDFNTESHCLYETWEMLQQSPLWDGAIAAIRQDGSENDIMIRLLKA